MVKKPNISGVILSGGKSSRMGTSKAFLQIDGETLISRTVNIMRPLFTDIIIVTNSPLSYLHLNVTIVSDIFKDKGALGGLYTGLFFASQDHAFVCACDMPFLKPSFIEFMTNLSGSYDIIVPDAGDGLQPLHAVYRKRCLPLMKSNLDRGNLKITAFYTGLRILNIGTDCIDSFDPSRKMFLNVNTSDDMQKVIT